MKIRNEIKTCKIHGETTFGIYQYVHDGKPYISQICLACTRDTKAKRRANKEKYDHDKKYSREWALDNKDRVREFKLIYCRKKSIIKQKPFNEFAESNKLTIINLLVKLKSPITFEQIKTRCARLKINNIDDLKKYIIYHKTKQLLFLEEWKQSTLVKYHNKVRGVYPLIPEVLKEKLRAEYKLKAKIIVDKKMQTLLQKIN
jgi:hypothetical protein